MEPWQYHDQPETDKWQLGSGHWWIARQNTVPSRLKWFWAISSLPAIKDHHIMSMNIYEPKNTDRKGKGITDEKVSSSTKLNLIHPHISHSCWFIGGQGRLAEWTKMFFSLVAMLFLTMPVIHGGRWPVQDPVASHTDVTNSWDLWTFIPPGPTGLDPSPYCDDNIWHHHYFFHILHILCKKL